MAINNIRLGGLSSGFDTESMVTQLLSSYQTRIDNQTKKLTKLSWQQNAYQDITTKITDFKNKYFDILKRDSYLMSPSTFNKFKANVSAKGDVDTSGLTVSTSSNAAVGNYKVKVNQLAASAKAEGNSITVDNFSLDLDKALSTGGGKFVTADDGSKTMSYNFALDVQVGSVKKTVEFSAEAAMNGDTVDTDALKQNMVENLNKQLKDSFGLSGKDDSEMFLQAELGADGKAQFKVGGNASVTVSENKGMFGIARPAKSASLSVGSVVTGTNTFAVEIGGNVHRLSFEGVSTTYYDSRNLAGNEDILKEYNQLKADAYRRENNLSFDAAVSEEQLNKFTYSGEQAAKDKNQAAIMRTLGNIGNYFFTLNGSTLTAKDSSGNAAEFSITAVDGGTLGIAKASASNKISGNVSLDAMGLKTNADGKYSLTINGTEITVDKDATVNGLVSAVNRSDAGVTMSYSSLTNSFTVESKEMGGAGKVDISGDLAKGLGLADDSGTVGFTAGQNAVFELNGQEIYLNDNSYTMDGVTFNFDEDIAIGETMTVNVTKDNSAVKDIVKGFVEDYNKLIDDVYGYIGKAPAKDSKGNRYEPLTDAEKEEMDEDEIKKWEDSAKQGILYNDSTVSGIMSRMRSALYSTVTMDDGSSFGIFSMGIKTTKEYGDHGKLEINEDAFDKAFEKYSDEIVKLFTDPADGMMNKLNKVMDSAVKSSGKAETRGSLIQKAGKANSSVTTDSYIYREMTRLQDRIKSLQQRYDDKEDYWWKIFTNMESAMTDLNGQTSYISQYLGGGTNYQ